MSLAVDLMEYFKYMKTLGFTGLNLPPEAVAALAPAPAPPPTQGRRPDIPNLQRTQRPQPQTREPHQRPARPTAAPDIKPKQAPKRPAPPTVPNIANIMNMVQTHSPVEETRAKVDAVRGDAPVDVLRGLYKAFRNCQACALGTTRSHFVFGEGPPQAPLAIVGGSPAQDEDQSGRPYMGAGGELLGKIINAMGLDRDQLFITHVVKCRPPQDRAPLPDELQACAPLLERQLLTVAPRVILVLGPDALRWFRGPEVSLMRVRGTFFEWRGRLVMPTFDPGYVLRNPRAKREVWADVQQVMAKLKEP